MNFTKLAVPWWSVVRRALLFAGGWFIITEGETGALLFGVPVVILALGASILLQSSPARWSATGLVRYLLAFLSGSLQGGVQVARVALAPGLALSPTLIRYHLRLRTEPARHLFMGTINLLPGTLTTSVQGDELTVHVLVDKGDALFLQMEQLEAHVARAVGEPIEAVHA